MFSFMVCTNVSAQYMCVNIVSTEHKLMYSNYNIMMMFMIMKVNNLTAQTGSGQWS